LLRGASTEVWLGQREQGDEHRHGCVEECVEGADGLLVHCVVLSVGVSDGTTVGPPRRRPLRNIVRLWRGFASFALRTPGCSVDEVGAEHGETGIWPSIDQKNRSWRDPILGK